MEWKVQLFRLNFDERETQAVVDIAQSGWLTMGEKTKTFESRFSTFVGEKSLCVAVSSGTAALHMALLALGVGPGDEVIVPALTFVADVNTVILAGGAPVLADCTSLQDWNVSPVDIEKKITPRTKAVMIVHYAGWPCDMAAIQRICRKHEVALIEDSAHAIGAEWAGRKCGTFGDVGCFSFFTNKNLSVGEGGMYITRSESLYREGLHLRSHGMSTLTLDRHQGRAISYDVMRPGLNYRIDEFRAALGIVQLEKLEAANACRERIWERYRESLAGLRAVTLPFTEHSSDARSCYHICPILLSPEVDRVSVIGKLKEQGIQSSIHYPSLQGFSAFTGLLLAPTPIANDISARELTLPLFPTMKMEEVDLVCESLRRALT